MAEQEYVYRPYPKMLYRNGEYRVADGYAQECEFRELGFGYGPDWVWPQPEGVVPAEPPAAPVVPDAPPVVVPDEPPVVVPSPEPPPVKRGRGRPRKVA